MLISVVFLFKEANRSKDICMKTTGRSIFVILTWILGIPIKLKQKEKTYKQTENVGTKWSIVMILFSGLFHGLLTILFNRPVKKWASDEEKYIFEMYFQQIADALSE